MGGGEGDGVSEWSLRHLSRGGDGLSVSSWVQDGGLVMNAKWNYRHPNRKSQNARGDLSCMEKWARTVVQGSRTLDRIFGVIVRAWVEPDRFPRKTLEWIGGEGQFNLGVSENRVSLELTSPDGAQVLYCSIPYSWALAQNQ